MKFNIRSVKLIWNKKLEGVVVRTNDYDKDNQISCSFKVKNLQYAEYGLGKISEKCREFKERS